MGRQPSSQPADETTTLSETKARATAVLAAIKRIEKALTDRSWSSAAASLDALFDDLQTVARQNERLDGFKRMLADRAERQLLELETDLREACTRRGWRVDGQWPSLYAERSISIEIDERKRTVRIGGQDAGEAEAHRIVRVLEPLVAQLLPKTFRPQGFLDQMAQAYDAVRPDAGLAPILEVYRSLVSTIQKPKFWRDAAESQFTALSMNQFRARLTQVLEGGSRCSDGRELRLQPPLDPKEAVFMYLPSERRYGYVGRVEFTAPRDPGE